MCQPAQSSRMFEDVPAIYQETVNKMKFQYFRIKPKKAKYDKNGNLVRSGSRGIKKGIMVAAPSPLSNDKMVVGYTLCNFKAGDKFDFELWLPVALDRAIIWAENEEVIDGRYDVPKFDIYSASVPESMKKDFANFLFRMKNWFKGMELPIWANLFLESQETIEDAIRKLNVRSSATKVY